MHPKPETYPDTRRTTKLGGSVAIALLLAVAATIAPTAASAATASLTETSRTEVPQNGFFSSFLDESKSSPAVGDVQGDGDAEVVIGGMDGRVAVLSLGGDVLGQYSIGAGAIHSSPTLADLNGDGKLDIIVGNTRGDVVAMTGTGSEIWRKRTNSEQEVNGVASAPDDIYSTPAVGDIDNDGQPEVVLASADHFLYAWNHDGTNVPGWPKDQYGTTWVSPSLADIDDDGYAEIIVAYDISQFGLPATSCSVVGSSIRAFEHTGDLKWERCIPNEVTFSSPAVADIDNDGRLELAIGSGNYFAQQSGDYSKTQLLWLIEADTGVVADNWPQDLGAMTDIDPAVGNLDGDPELEIVTTAADGWVSAYNADGSLLWRSCGMAADASCPFETSNPNPLDAPASIADVDNDGEQEVISFMHTDLIIHEGATGDVEARHRVEVSYAPNAQPTVVEIDGETRIFVQTLKETNGDGARSAGDVLLVVSATTGTPLGAAPWPMTRQNTTHTGSDETSWSGLTWAEPWLRAVYVDLLGREADASGLDYWTGRLSGGMSKPEVGQQFATTPEWLGKVIDDLYADVLGREPDAGGREFWIGQLQAGMSTAHVVSSFFASDEYFDQAGGTNEGFVDELYQAILRRSPDADGRTFWVGRLDAGEPRGTLSSQIFSSFESGKLRVESLYEDLLGRDPDPDGREYWGHYLETGDEIDLTAFLIDSDEYQTRAESRFDD